MTIILYILLYFMIGTAIILLAIFTDVLKSPFYKPPRRKHEWNAQYERRVKLHNENQEGNFILVGFFWPFVFFIIILKTIKIFLEKFILFFFLQLPKLILSFLKKGEKNVG